MIIEWVLPLSILVMVGFLIAILAMLVHRNIQARAAPTTLHLHTIHWSTGFVTYVQDDQFVTSTLAGELRSRGRLEYVAPSSGATQLPLHFVEARGERGTYTLHFSADNPLKGTYTGPDREDGEFRIVPP